MPAAVTSPTEAQSLFRRGRSAHATEKTSVPPTGKSGEWHTPLLLLAASQ